MLKSAFNAMISMHGRNGTLKRIGVSTSAIRFAPSNYARKLEGPSEVIIEGREFIVPKDMIQTPMSPLIRRGDRIVDAELGEFTIDEVKELYDFGGAILGFRVRTN